MAATPDDGAEQGRPALGPADYAFSCVEAFVTGRPVPPAPEDDFYTRQASCFVSLKKQGELRGCIGTLAPAEPDVGREIARNAHSAAFQDPRFSSVRPEELSGMTCSVDVLSEAEDCTLDELDPSCFGVIVTLGFRRGVLLPDLPGVDTVERQVGIALQKAGIAPDEPFAVERFTVDRYRQGETPRA